MKIASAARIREAERNLFRSGEVTSSDLMERVVRRMAAQLCSGPAGWGAAGVWKPEGVLLYLGKGNNAGDAAGLAACVASEDCPVYVRCACEPHELAADTLTYLRDAGGRGATVNVLDDAPAAEDLPRNLLLVDGLLGSGAQGALRPAYAALVAEMNGLRALLEHSLLLAVDIPTGLDPVGGVFQEPTVHADITAAIGCVKPGMLVDGAEEAVGRLLCIPLPEVEVEAETGDVVIDAANMRGLRPRRAISCFKNRAGRVDIVAGSVGYTGAARLCAEAAVAAGAGLVALYCPREIYPVLAAGTTPEVMVRPVDSYAEVPLTGAQAWVIGPGLGTPASSEQAALRYLISHAEGPVVMDADALNLAAAHSWDLPATAILTPHPGEMRRLFPAGNALSRRECVRRFVQEHACTLLLKGARTLVSDGETTYYNSSGGPFMANGGQGDTLAGVIGAYCAAGMRPVHAAALAAWHCGLAAEYSHARLGHPAAVTASQVIAALPMV